MKYRLAIAHRVCPALAKTASNFASKFEMVKATAISLSKAIKGIDVKTTVILDGCSREYEQFFDSVFGGCKGYSRISTPAIGNAATYAKQLEILSRDASEAEYLYFSEDDYLYRSCAFLAMMDFLKVGGVDFVTPLDHPDGYQPDRERENAGVIRVSAHCHWREAASTCCTFMLKSSTFLAARKSLAYYTHGCADYLMWLLLTKKGVYSPSCVFGGATKYIFGRPRNWMNVIPACAWLKLGPRLLLAPRFRLWSPMPSLAVHLCKPSLPPFAKEVLKSISIPDDNE